MHIDSISVASGSGSSACKSRKTGFAVALVSVIFNAGILLLKIVFLLFEGLQVGLAFELKS